MSNKSEFKLIAESASSKLGLKFDSFIGKGAFKETFKVLNEQNKPIALKIFDPNKFNRERSDREIDAMKRCNSIFIGKLYFFGLFSDYAFSLEEYFDGGTLTEKLNGRLLTLIETRGLGIAIVKALDHLKGLKLVHRDIKPDNIMYRQTSKTPALVDFGLVRNLSESSLTMSWVPQGPGTPFFSAPEQLNNEKSMIGWKTDQFSLGIVLGFCSSGFHPFQEDGMSIQESISAMASRSKVAPRFNLFAERTGLNFLLKMLEPWPHRRFNEPKILLEAIERME